MRKILLLLLSCYVLLSCDNTAKKQAVTAAADTTATVEEKIEKRMYGILIDTFVLDHGEIEANKSLGEILGEWGVDNKTIFEIARQSDTVFDVRKIRAGNNYAVLYSEDSVQKLEYFVYEINPVDFVVYDLVDSVRVYRGKKDVHSEEKIGEGVIESSLWNAMAAGNMNPVLSLELSDIYAWTIDFFGLQKGDSFKVVYEEEYVDTVSVGIKSIKYALFNHMGEDYFAIPFEQDSSLCFYDTDGQSLRKAFLKAPLHYSRISSRFSNSRMHPVLRIRRPHHGVDYAAPVGTPVVAIGDGIVIKKGYSGGAGNMVKIKHNSIYTTAYLHLSKYGEGVHTGAKVKQGQVIGYVGSSGLSTGPHLDFRFYKSGVPVDPLKVKAPPVEPVHDSLMPKFDVLKDSLVKILKQ